VSTPYDALPPPPPGQQPWQPGQPALPGYYSPAPPGPAETGPVEYHRIQRIGRWGARGWWRPVVGLITLLVLAFIAAPVVLLLGFLAYFAISGADDLDRKLVHIADTDNVTPSVLAFINLSWAVAIPCALLVLWLFHRLKPGWLSSVTGRLRLRWLVTCFGLAFVALIATVVVSAVLPSSGDSSDMSGQVNDWSTTMRDFVLVIVLLTPLQAAGEEYAFRGYLTQAFGGLFAPLGPQVSRAAAVLLPATLFALAHGAQDAPIFIDRFSFGLVAGILVITTGGLEAGIAMHVLNNFLAFGVALAYSDMTTALTPTDGTWWQVPVTLTQSVVYLGLATWVARRRGIATRTTPLLEASEPRV
jgi:membrane protease YdiL (CAAX protease family)